MKDIDKMTVNEMKTEATDKMKQLGFSQKEIDQIAENLEAMAAHLTILDQAMRSLPVNILEVFQKAGVQAMAKGIKLDTERQKRLAVLLDMAKTYQADFGTTADNTPETNVFGMHGAIAA